MLLKNSFIKRPYLKNIHLFRFGRKRRTRKSGIGSNYGDLPRLLGPNQALSYGNSGASNR